MIDFKSLSLSQASNYMSWVATRAQTYLKRSPTYMSWAGARARTRLKRSPSNVKTLWLSTQRQAYSDFRARAGRGCLWVLAVLWFLGLTTGFVLLSVWSVFESSARAGYGSACLPDDSFSLRPDTYRYWSNSGFFQITLGSGSLTFTQAKAIDVIWDIVIGRGGQALLAYLSWQTFVRYVTTSMEVQPVTFHTYRTIFLQNESLVLGIPRIIRDFCRRRNLHSRFAMVFIVMTMLFILIFPTLGGSMTGYSGNVNAYILDTDEKFIPFRDFEIVVYTVHDGSRINLTDDFHATIYKNKADDPSLLDVIDWYSIYYPRDITQYCSENSGEDRYLECTSDWILYNISMYITSYGPYPQTNVASEFGDGISLTAPTLKITSYQWPLSLNGTKGGDGRVYQQDAANFLSGNTLYSESDVEDRAQCQAENTYKWGFSFIQLAFMLILLWIWTIGIIVMYMTSKLTRLQRGRPEVAGEYKAVFELADAMHTQLTELTKEEGSSDDVRGITESSLRQRIKSDLRGGAIAYDTNILLDKSDEPGDVDNWTLKAWARREVWWFLALALAIAIDGVAISQLVKTRMESNLWFFPALPLAIGFAMFVSLTHASRGMVLLWAVLVACVLPAIVVGSVVKNYVDTEYLY